MNNIQLITRTLPEMIIQHTCVQYVGLVSCPGSAVLSDFSFHNHILIDFIYSFPYRKVCNYFQIAHLFSVIAHLFNQSEARTF